MGTGAEAMEPLSLGAACVLSSFPQHWARTNSADVPRRIDIQDKRWCKSLVMMAVAPEWPARA